MIYAMYEQILERIPEERRVKNARIGLTHNLGGLPHDNVAAISTIGRD
jgi:acetyl-CoA C-acetyltransferase